MSKKEKAILKLRQNPKHVRFEDVEIILFRLGFEKRQDGTSHAIFTLDDHRIQVPKRKPFVKPIYVKLLLEELDKIQELNDLEEED
jgi:hypothetical protein